jgi:serine/threonine protein kinase
LHADKRCQLTLSAISFGLRRARRTARDFTNSRDADRSRASTVTESRMFQRIGKYEVIDQIGRGGMGTIFRARDPILERSVALKVISDLEVTPELRSRFFREAQACARIAHPNIVIVHDMGEDDGRLFIVMELLDGEELGRVIARHEQLSLPEKLSIVRQLCDGLHFAHQKGVVHRDVKPANILLLRTGRVKIVDFGIAQLAGAATQRDLTRTGMIMGTIRYMAPEQVRGQADRRSDIFSVAAVSYELLSGHPPFSGNDPLQILEQLRTATPPRLTEMDPNLPSDLADVIARGIQKEPSARFADLEQMGRELARIQRDLAAEAERVDASDRPRSFAPALPVAAPAPPPVAMAPPASASELAVPAGPPQPKNERVRASSASGPRRLPRVAIGTGVGLAVIVGVTLYWLLPTAPRSPVTETPAAVLNSGAVEQEATAEPPRHSGLARDAAPRPAAEKSGETERPHPTAEKPSASVRASIPARSTSKSERASTAPLERAETNEIPVPVPGERGDAERARSRMTVARQAAARVAAGFHARARFASAQSKERDGVAAMGRGDYAVAGSLFTEAQAEYQAARAEVPREEEKERQLALLRSDLDQAHAAVAARRRQALAAEADQLARASFDQAQARQVEGDGLASRKELAAAARAYRDAAEGYADAERRARAARSVK